MKLIRLSAVLAAFAAMAVADVGQSSSHVSGPVVLMDFEMETDTLLGYPRGNPPLGWFVRTEHTQHAPGIVDPKRPPSPGSPCLGLARAWNRIIARSDETQRRAALAPILGQMARHQCTAIIDRDVNSDPQVIISIRPTGE
jgi:hypothetical protein